MGIFERWRRRRSGGRDSEANALLGQRLEEDAPHDVDTQLTIGAPVHAAVAARRIADEALESSLLTLALDSTASRAIGRLRYLGCLPLALWLSRHLSIVAAWATVAPEVIVARAVLFSKRAHPALDRGRGGPHRV